MTTALFTILPADWNKQNDLPDDWLTGWTKPSKTTAVYAHVSNQNLQNIKNPFDDLDI
jgi:hypothetical protein